jgi:phosphoglycolate phosphatase-like HAD superfamily hydrolase
MPDTVLFDFDGTLIDSVGPMYDGACNVFRMSQLAIPSFAEFCETCESPFLGYYRKRGVTAPTQDITRWYDEAARLKERPFFPDTVSTIIALAGRGVLMGIVSANRRDKIVRLAEEAGIEDFMEVIVGGAHDKVDPIKNFCGQRGIVPRNTLFVGDFVSDVRDAKLAGVIAVGITRGRDVANVLKRAGADYVITDLRELLNLL